MDLIGHRGLTLKHTENTLESFMDAFEHGADGVEMDVQLTMDNVPVIFHDFDLKRMFGIDKKISEMNLIDLRKLRLKKGEFIPTLFEVLERLRGKKLFIELKTVYDDFTRINVKMPEIVSDVIDNFDKRNIIIISFDPGSLSDFREMDDSIKLGLDYEENSERLISGEFLYEIMEENNIEYFLPEYSIAKKYAFLSKRYTVIPWVINGREQYENIRGFSHGIISDRVDMMKNIVK
ncbi:MAG: glycerophosphodiester phosphodiesterase [Thermoplasmata archaeon]